MINLPMQVHLSQKTHGLVSGALTILGSEKVSMGKEQAFWGLEGSTRLGKDFQIITRIHLKEAVLFPARKIALSATTLIILLATRLRLKSLYCPSILEIFPQYCLAYFPHLHFLRINSSLRPTSDVGIGCLHPHQITVARFAKWMEKASGRISQGIR